MNKDEIKNDKEEKRVVNNKDNKKKKNDEPMFTGREVIYKDGRGYGFFPGS